MVLKIKETGEIKKGGHCRLSFPDMGNPIFSGE
jgi:hypothetical protein